jgi:hypothetical protein
MQNRWKNRWQLLRTIHRIRAEHTRTHRPRPSTAATHRPRTDAPTTHRPHAGTSSGDAPTPIIGPITEAQLAPTPIIGPITEAQLEATHPRRQRREAASWSLAASDLTTAARVATLAAGMLRMADSQDIQTETLSPGMQAMLQQQSALMQRQNQIAGTMMKLLERLQETMEMTPMTPRERPPSEPLIQTEPPSAASHTARALILVVDLTLDDEMGD